MTDASATFDGATAIFCDRRARAARWWSKSCEGRYVARRASSNGRATDLALSNRGVASAALQIKSASSNDLYRTVTVLLGKGKQTRLRVHRYALLGPSDAVHADARNAAR